MSRPSEYSEATDLIICERIANGESLRSVCSDDDMPDAKTVYRWMNTNDGFRQRYARAREEQADAIADEILDIADDGRNDWMVRNGDDEGGWQVNGEHIQRSRVRIDARKWLAAKLSPKKYGEKQEVHNTGEITIATKEQRDASVAAAQRANQ